MDPISITTGVAKALSIAWNVGGFVQTLIRDYHNAPKSMRDVSFSVRDMKNILTSLQLLLNDLLGLYPSRKSMVELDHLVTMVTQSTITFLELQEVIEPIQNLRVMPLWNKTKIRLEWTRKEKTIQKMVEQLESHKSSLELVASILGCKSDIMALQSQRELMSRMERLLEQNEDMRNRLARLEATGEIKRASIRFFEDESGNEDRDDNLTIRLFEGQSTDEGEEDEEDNLTIRPKNSGKRPLYSQAIINHRLSFRGHAPPEFEPPERPVFELMLEESRVYRRVEQNDCDISLRSSVALTHAWSILSGLSLSQISAVSIIMLPLWNDELQRVHKIPNHTMATSIELEIEDLPPGSYSDEEYLRDFDFALPRHLSDAEQSTEDITFTDPTPILFMAASILAFRREYKTMNLGFPHLTYEAGAIYDIFAQRGELWLARDHFSPQGEIGWVQKRDFIVIVPEI